MQAWEHCQLLLLSAEPIQEKGGGLLNKKLAGWGYDCALHVFNSAKEVEKIIVAGPDKPLRYDPWAKKLAELGAEGWEMVSVQHLQQDVEFKAGKAPTIYAGARVAYLKRKVE